MKLIVKAAEPPAFTTWKLGSSSDWNPGWGELDGSPMKKVVKKAILDEQGYICCYCGMRIADMDSHIEHFRPRHGPHAYPAGEIEYANMLASCLPDTHEGSKPHCGMKKGASDPSQIVSPLEPTCESRFSFGSGGTITPANTADPIADNTIRQLGLNIAFLVAHRRKALEASGLFDALETATADQIQTWAARLMQRHADGTFTEFCVSTAYVLRSYA